MTKRTREKRQTTIDDTLHRETNDRATRTPLKTGDGPMCSGRVDSSCCTFGMSSNIVLLVVNDGLLQVKNNTLRPYFLHLYLFTKYMVVYACNII